MGKIYDGIMGLVVGDALGVPFEFLKRDSFKATDMVGYGTHYQPAGTWSDDSSLALATLESLHRLKRIDLSDIMHNFCRWLTDKKFSPYNEVFDIGNTTRKAIMTYINTKDVSLSGCSSVYDNGNGSLMRILPLAFFPHTKEDVIAVSALTHAHEISTSACVKYIELAEALLKGCTIDTFAKYYDPCKDIRKKQRNDIRSGGFVLDTLEAAVWCFTTTASYRECVLKAVNLGDDTDTTSAVTGGLAGIYYGCVEENGIPESWINQIPLRNWIQKLCEN